MRERGVGKGAHRCAIWVTQTNPHNPCRAERRKEMEEKGGRASGLRGGWGGEGGWTDALEALDVVPVLGQVRHRGVHLGGGAGEGGGEERGTGVIMRGGSLFRALFAMWVRWNTTTHRHLHYYGHILALFLGVPPPLARRGAKCPKMPNREAS